MSILGDKKNNKGICKALVVNSGNANAHTGLKGLETIEKYAKDLWNYLSCSKKEILVSSTGVIGEHFDSKKISSQINQLNKSKNKTLIDAAKAICTTDTFVKTSVHNFKIQNKIIKIYGFCNVCGMEATKTYRKTEGGDRTQVGAADIYEPRCLKHWEAR